MPKSRRRKVKVNSQGVSVLVLIAIVVAVWYQGKIPGLPKPDKVLPAVKSLSTYIPDAEAVRTLIPGLGSTPSSDGSPVSSPAGDLPEMSVKPQPQSSTFQGCPPEGDGGDAEMNILKNRIDEGNYVPVSFDSIAGLTWPPDVERRDRENWSVQDADTIGKYEGIPVSVEGYLTAATESGSESTNCHATDNELVDWHISLVKNPGEDRSLAVVTETTPRIRAKHNWTLGQLRDLIKSQERVRISGWLFFDPEHPDHLGKYRITLWEVHPIMQIEVLRDGIWVALDDLQ